MKNFGKVLIGLFLVLLTVSPGWAVLIQRTIPVTASSDDHFEKDKSSNGDTISGALTDTALDMGKRRIGLRFLNVQVPRNQTISKAWIEFHATSSNKTADLQLKIKGEKSAAPATFKEEKNNIKNRWDTYKTDAAVDWDITDDWSNNLLITRPATPTASDSPDIKTIIQEIVNLTDWDSGDNLVLMLSRRDTGTDNMREVVSFDGKGSNAWAPTLIIEYDDGGTGSTTTCEPVNVRVTASSDDAEQYKQNGNQIIASSNDTMRWGERWLGLRFQNIAIPAGATITEAYVDIAAGNTSDVSNSNDSDKAEMRIYGDATNDAVTFSSSDSIRSRSRTNANVTWTETNYWESYKEVKRSPDITDVIQEIVSRSGWSSGNDLALILEERAGRRPALSYDDDTALAPLLHIAYTTTSCGGSSGGGTTTKPTIQISIASSPTSPTLGASTYEGQTAATDTLTIGNIGSANLNYTISGIPSWLTLTKGGTVLTSAYSSATTRLLAPSTNESFTVSYLSSTLAIGTHQATLTFSDPTATNPDVLVTVSITILQVPDSSGSCSNVPLYVQNRVSPAVLINLDLSGSMDTKMTIVQSTDLPTTPELSTIVQEIVNRTGWIAGADMVFIIKGSGNRRAWSYDGRNESAPLLSISYTSEGITSTISVRVAANKDDAEEDGTSNYQDTSTALDLGNQDVGIRFQSLNIPQNATINSALIYFTPSNADSSTANLTIYGEASNDAAQFSSNAKIDSRTLTSATVSWSPAAWAAPTEKTRLAIAQDVINQIVQNQNINWGFGIWEGDQDSAIDYNEILVGCKLNDVAHMTAIQTAVSATQTGGRTPFVPSMLSAGKYFAGTKNATIGGAFTNLTCQDKFLIEITDGLGNIPTDTNAAAATAQTNALATAGISTVAVGFGIDDASMINAVAEAANTKGKVSETDNVYPLHEEVSSVGKPFLAMNQQELLTSLLDISHKIENRFTGSAPAPTTSADDQDLLIVLIAEFGSASWTGDLRAVGFSLLTNDWTDTIWRASERMPTTRNVWTVNSSGVKELYTTSTLANDNYLCKDIGDIINSAPVIVKWPNSHYTIDNYRAFYDSKKNRNNMVYVGANDGQLHAFLLTNKMSGTTITTNAGTEMWSFVPRSLLPNLNRANDRTYNMCDTGYCHQYFVDGSPQAADIYKNSQWYTILISGLREGGESYFALDITDGEPMNSTTGANADGAKYLWEFTHANLGQTWGDPRIKRVVDSATTGARAWGAFFGSGYAADGAASAAQVNNVNGKEAYLFGIDAYDASPLWGSGASATNNIKLSSTKLTNDAVSEILMVDKDFEEDFATDFIYAGNLYGDLYRVKNIGKGQTPVVSLFYESNNTATVQPIRARPSFAYTENAGEYWLYFGTGRYELDFDKTTKTPQYFFGLKETPDSSSNYTTTYTKPSTLDSFVMTDKFTTNKLPVSGDPKMVVLDATSHTITVGGTAKVIKVIEGKNAANDSWVIRLANSTTTYAERVVNQPLVVGGVVFFTSFVPDNDPCGGSGGSYLYAIDYQTGLAPTKPVFDINDDGTFSSADTYKQDLNGDGDTDDANETMNIASVYVGKGQASQPVIVGDKIFITTTEPGEADEENPGDINPTKPFSVNIEGLNSSLDSWLDRSFK